MKKKLWAVVGVGAIAMTSLAGFAGCGGGSADTFTWWIPAGDPTYYANYEDNPVLSYISEFVELKKSDGTMGHINFDFVIPANSASAITDFNNMIQNRDFEDIMDPSQYSGSVADLYEHDIIIDLTPYVTDPDVMPNLAKWYEENPELAAYTYTTLSDGTKKVLAFPGVTDELDSEAQAFGFNYRRDWLVKYGTQPAEFFDPMKDDAPRANPKAGQAFSGHFTLNADGTERNDPMGQDTSLPEGADGQSWVDDIVFPSGNTDPIYISDWQWMFEIYETAYADLGITDSYMMSIYYPGYIPNGDLVTGFGGGGAYWYKDENNDCQFGMLETGFRAYLECMRNWYTEGWLDNKFNEKTDVFYAIDNAEIAEGNVALWMGNSTRLGTLMATETGNAAGAIVFGAANPINDIPAYDGDINTTSYMTKATAEEAEAAMSGGEGSDYMLQIPTVMFQNEQLGGGAVISREAAENKDLTLILSFFDYLYSEEGSLLYTMGLSKEQYEESGSEIYSENGLTEGAYVDNGDGTYSYVSAMEENALGIRNAMLPARIPGLKRASVIKYDFAPTYINSRYQWVRYPATGFIGGMISNSATPEETEIVGNIRLPIEENYLYRNVYQFIRGEKSIGADWTGFCAGIVSYHNRGTYVEDVTEIYNGIFDRLYGTN